MTGQRQHKYNARRTLYNDAWYESKGEADYARTLDLLKAAGSISDWRRGGVWLLLEKPNEITLEPDFAVWVQPVTFTLVPVPGRRKSGPLRQKELPSRLPDRLIDFKGMVTPIFRLKAKLFKARHPGVPLWIVKADGTEKLA